MSDGARWQVVKLGGSLLEWPGLRGGLRHWLQSERAARLIVVGGGAAADAIRSCDRVHGLEPSDAHWLAVRTMGLNARLVQALLPELPLVDRLEELPLAPPSGAARLVDPWHFLRDVDARRADPLPIGWEVTSDSIAARLAEYLGAEELVLLKSALPAAGMQSRADAAAAGYVDEHFPRAARNVPRVRCVDLRGDRLPQCQLT